MSAITDFYINERGYESAQQYYQNIKEQAFEKLRLQTDEQKRQLLNQSYIGVSEMFSEVDTVTTELDKQFELYVVEQVNNIFRRKKVKNAKQNLKNKIEKVQKTGKGNYDAARKKLVEAIRQEMVSLINVEDILNQLYKNKKIKGDLGSSSTVVARYTNYLTQKILSSNKTLKQYATTLNKSSLAGYHYELAKADAFKKISNDDSFVSKHMGDQTLQGKDTVIDIAVGTTGQLKENALSQLQQGLDLIQNIQVSGKNEQPALFQNYIQSLDSFGIQTKLGTLTSKAKKQNGFYIKSDENLLKQILSNYNSSVKLSRSVFAAKYFGDHLTAILQVFGPNQLIFSSGYQTYYVDDFIKQFRNQNQFLAFKAEHQNKLSSSVYLLQKQQILKQ